MGGVKVGQLTPVRSRRPQEYIPDNQIQLTALGQKQGEAAGEQIRTLVGNSTVPWGRQQKKRNATHVETGKGTETPHFFLFKGRRDGGNKLERCREIVQKLIVVPC